MTNNVLENLLIRNQTGYLSMPFNENANKNDKLSLPVGLFRNIHKWEFKNNECWFIGWESKWGKT